MSRVVRIHQHGGPEVLRMERLDLPPPQAGEVAITVKAIGLNRSEVMFRNGAHLDKATFPAKLGYEAAGVVSALGAGVEGLAVGDPVSVVPPPTVTRWGTYGEVATVPAENVVRHPQNLSWVEAAAVWMAHVTAYGSLIDIAGLKAGETVLVLAASSSVGLAAFQIAKMVGASVVATTRTADKRQALLDAGADYVIVTKEEDLVARVMEITAGSGARVVFDPIAGPGIKAVISATSRHGIIIVYGLLDPAPTPLPLFPLIGKGISIRGFTFREIVSDAGRRTRAVSFILDGLASGQLKPVISKVFELDEIQEAHRYIESNAAFGKVVVAVDKH